MEKLVVSAFLEEGRIKLLLDGEEIFNPGELHTSMELKSGENYCLHWFVQARFKSVFSITVSSPSAAEFKLTQRIGVTGKEIGGYYFKL
ncbi:hypothetical protein SAMN04489724_0641 [Algoriphagus locisalis]|uniref:Uncharacterized protein n=1 Tax=Algoriphagus locisalis TaxID=305507 RepID=A0A1I6XSU6_9BACT|nr:hypothetical protein [Algoriphagus locisalis]SFT41187.1 hypothetical protein SAMN04489724_0641 [Algoriphagus locisalis]